MERDQARQMLAQGGGGGGGVQQAAGGDDMDVDAGAVDKAMIPKADLEVKAGVPPAVETPSPRYQGREGFDGTLPMDTKQHLNTEEQTQHLPTSLIRSVRIAVHVKADVLRRLLVLHLQLALAGRLPQDLTPPPTRRTGSC